MRKGFIGLCHPVRIFLLLERCPGGVERIEQLGHVLVAADGTDEGED